MRGKGEWGCGEGSRGGKDAEDGGEEDGERRRKVEKGGEKERRAPGAPGAASVTVPAERVQEKRIIS